jgi:serine/threonine protein kinase
VAIPAAPGELCGIAWRSAMEEHAKAWAFGLDGRTVGGRYRLGKPIGVGGMGAVFEGVHQAVGRVVAIKLLYPELTQSTEAVRRFQQEAQAAAAIARRGVVDILDFDVDPQLGPYLVMERLQGESLLTRIKTTGRLEPREAIAIGVQIADTLAAVHERGIIHRDLKPANVFLSTSDGGEVVKILDFGISKLALAPGKAPLTVPGTVLGTPRYMAPEQASCEPDVDHRADLYSVGLILYHALSGVKPFADVSRGALLVAVIRDGPRPLRFVRPGLPEGVYAVVEQSMEHRRDERFQSAVALSRSLQQVLERLPSAVAPRPAPRPRLTTGDDFEATAIETSTDSTMRSADPIAAPLTAPSASPVRADVARSTISEIPSGRLQALVQNQVQPQLEVQARAGSSYPGAVPDLDDFAAEAVVETVTDQSLPFHVRAHEEQRLTNPGAPGQPPDTVEVVREPSMSPPDGRSSPGGWVEYGTAASTSGVSVSQAPRGSGELAPFGDDRSTQNPTVPRGHSLRQTGQRQPPATMVLQSGPTQEDILPGRAQPSRPSATSSTPPRKSGRRWLTALLIVFALAIAGVGGVLLGLYLWNVVLDK